MQAKDPNMQTDSQKCFIRSIIRHNPLIFQTMKLKSRKENQPARGHTGVTAGITELCLRDRITWASAHKH